MYKKFSDLKVGDQVWLVENDDRHKKPRYVTVDKVGRKYIHIKVREYESQKFESWDFDGYAIGITQDFPHSTIYNSEEDYNEMISWKIALSTLRDINAAKSISRENRNMITKLVLGEMQ